MTAAALAVSSVPDPISPGMAEPVADLTTARAAAGDAEAFRVLYRAHVGRVHAVCLRLAGDSQLAEEWTQDVFVRAWEALRGFRGESSFGTWLHRIAINVALANLRGLRRRERRLPLWADPPDVEDPGAHDPGRALDLERAIAALPGGCRTVFVLHDVEGLRHEEIAAQLGLAIGTCKAHLFRARRLLRARLS